MANKKIAMMFNSETVTGSDYYRAILPCKFLGPELKAKGIDLVLTDNYNNCRDADAFFVHRIVSDDTIRFLASEAAAKDKWVHWDCDDLLSEMPDYNPLKRLWTDELEQAWYAIQWIADSVSFSTDHLRKKIFEKVSRSQSEVLPNLYDEADYQVVNKKSNKIRILWAGSDTHEKDLQQIVKPLQRVVEKYKDQVEIVFFGYAPPELLVSNFSSVSVVQKCQVNMYPRILCSLAPDVGLCPLLDNDFNRSKSECKAFEMAAAGALTLTQGGVAYNSQSSLFSCKTEEDWFLDISEIIEMTKEKRDSIRGQLLFSNAQEHSWQRSKKKQNWLSLLERIVS